MRLFASRLTQAVRAIDSTLLETQKIKPLTITLLDWFAVNARELP